MTKVQDADAYETLLTSKVVLELNGSDGAQESEFVAGPIFSVPVFETWGQTAALKVRAGSPVIMRCGSRPTIAVTGQQSHERQFAYQLCMVPSSLRLIGK
jgi:hypothetical protein